MVSLKVVRCAVGLLISSSCMLATPAFGAESPVANWAVTVTVPKPTIRAMRVAHVALASRPKGSARDSVYDAEAMSADFGATPGLGKGLVLEPALFIVTGRPRLVPLEWHLESRAGGHVGVAYTPAGWHNQRADEKVGTVFRVDLGDATREATPGVRFRLAGARAVLTRGGARVLRRVTGARLPPGVTLFRLTVRMERLLTMTTVQSTLAFNSTFWRGLADTGTRMLLPALNDSYAISLDQNGTLHYEATESGGLPAGTLRTDRNAPTEHGPSVAAFTLTQGGDPHADSSPPPQTAYAWADFGLQLEIVPPGIDSDGVGGFPAGFPAFAGLDDFSRSPVQPGPHTIVMHGTLVVIDDYLNQLTRFAPSLVPGTPIGDATIAISVE